jgi:hypothetical protein
MGQWLSLPMAVAACDDALAYRRAGQTQPPALNSPAKSRRYSIAARGNRRRACVGSRR